MNISKKSREVERKRLRRLQHAVAPDWSSLAVEAMTAFTIETGLTIYSTAGRQLRLLDRGKYRRLSHSEKCQLWTVVRTGLDGRGMRLSCRVIEIGLRAVGLMAPLPCEVAR